MRDRACVRMLAHARRTLGPWTGTPHRYRTRTRTIWRMYWRAMAAWRSSPPGRVPRSGPKQDRLRIDSLYLLSCDVPRRACIITWGHGFGWMVGSYLGRAARSWWATDLIRHRTGLRLPPPGWVPPPGWKPLPGFVDWSTGSVLAPSLRCLDRAE